MRANKKALLLLAVLILILLLIMAKNSRKLTSNNQQLPQAQASSQPQSEDVLILSTNPPNLDGSTITPSQNISFTFNYPVLNKDEFRSSITPVVDYTIKLSDDRKTVTVIPAKPYGFTQGYTFHINKDTKFEGGKKMPTDKDINFRTISYSGV